MPISRLDDGRKLQFEVCAVYTQVPSKCDFLSSSKRDIAINSHFDGTWVYQDTLK